MGLGASSGGGPAAPATASADDEPMGGQEADIAGVCPELAAEGLPQLEEQWVEVNEELQFRWHRPPLEVVEQQWQDPGTVRILLNGCFDLMHVGHFNALRQAKSLFNHKGYRRVILVAGIHSDAAITKQKGAPLMSDEERLTVLRATKWVDELATELPYVAMSASMADALRVHFICHGDDLPICKGGGGMYSDVIAAGRFQMLKRTEGISTTHILERLLRRSGEGSGGAAAVLGSAPATTQRLAQFAAPADASRRARPLSAARRVVYVAGAFDLLHAGHVQLLEHAARLGDYLLVGLHSDEVLRTQRGTGPVLTLLERAMAVLSLRPVDDVVLGAPWLVSKELLSALNVAVVAVGRRPWSGDQERDGCNRAVVDPRLALPRELGILTEIESSCALTADALKARFRARSAEFAKRNSGLMAKELAYIEAKSYVPEA